MTREERWEKIRRIKWSYEPPPDDWPKGIRPISLEGTSLFGLDPKGRLYWDGEEIVVTRKLELTRWQRVWAGVVAGAAILASIAQFLPWLGFARFADLCNRIADLLNWLKSLG